MSAPYEPSESWRARPRPRWLVPAVAIGAVLLLVVLPLVASYNGLVDKDTKVDQSFADLDAQLQRRNDLIPNLVNAVRGVLKQEQTVFGDLARARQGYAGATTTQQKEAAANQIDAGIGRLLVIVESYPQLRSNENVQDLQTQLEGTENRIAQARRDYNAVVTSYDNSIRHFPRSMWAGIFGFHHRPLFQANAGARNPPNVNLDVSPSTTAPGP